MLMFDHNRVCESQQYLEGNVVSVVDYHEDESCYTSADRRIETVRKNIIVFFFYSASNFNPNIFFCTFFLRQDLSVHAPHGLRNFYMKISVNI